MTTNQNDPLDLKGQTEKNGKGKRSRSDARASSAKAPPPPESPNGAKILGNGIAVVPGKGYYERKTSGGEDSWFLLANFDAWIVAELHTQDDLTPGIEIVIAGQLMSGEPLPEITIPASEYSGMAWPVKHWGGRVIIAHGATAAGKLRAAIQYRSQMRGFESTTVYCYTGWVQIAGRWMYLHAGGAIDTESLRTDVTTRLQGNLGNVYFPEISGSIELLRADAKAFTRILDLAPERLTAPLFAAVAAAILNAMVTVDFVLLMHGPTGVGKTELASIVQGCFGAGFNGRNTIASWTATVNYIEKLLHGAKDILALIDDMNPDGPRHERERKKADQDRLHRAVGNQQGRGRLRSDATMQPTPYPRCLPVETAEDRTTGHSSTGRSLTLEVNQGDVRWDVLTELQRARDAGVLARITATFIQYVAGHWKEVEAFYKAEVTTTVTHLRTQGFAHSRNPQTIGVLVGAAATWLHVMQDLGAISIADENRVRERVERGFEQAADEQGSAISDSDPINQFLELLPGTIQSGAAHLADAESNESPPHATMLGWRKDMVNTSGYLSPVYRPQGTRIGWIDDRGIFLMPDAVLAAVQGFAAKQGISIPWTAKTLGKRLRDAGHLLSVEVGRNTQKVSIAGSQQRAWHIDRNHIITVAIAEGQQVVNLADRKGVA